MKQPKQAKSPISKKGGTRSKKSMITVKVQATQANKDAVTSASMARAMELYLSTTGKDRRHPDLGTLARVNTR